MLLCLSTVKSNLFCLGQQMHQISTSWPWSYGSLIYNYLCNQWLSALTFWVRMPAWRCIFDITLRYKVCQWLVILDRWFSPDTLLSSTNKTDRHDMTEILLKMALNTINQETNQSNINTTINDFHLKSPNKKMTKEYRFGNPGPFVGLVQKCGGIKLV